MRGSCPGSARTQRTAIADLIFLPEGDKSCLEAFRASKMSDGRLSTSLLPRQELLGLSQKRNTEVIQLLRTLQLPQHF
jgi:hypothetical protein